MDEVEEIKRRIDIIEFISSYLTVKKAGANYRSLCPFHTEKTASMMISPEKQIFKCFGCGEGGDVLSFVMKMENLGFREALEMLAARAGVRLEKFKKSPEYQKEKDEKTRLYEINHWSARLFHEILMKHPTGKNALEYLKKRGLNIETIKTFMIGYAPPFAKATGGKPSLLTRFLNNKGYTDTEIQSAGGPDRFFKRIIFPIADVMGNVLGFTGRVIEPKQEPKYLNTPETIIFHKGRILYNLDKARGEIKLAKTTVVVEGQMDVISSWQAGVKNVVATSGTALTDEHLRILYRYTPNITFSFDADTAGLTTAKKAYEMALVEGMNVKMVELADFKDPGEMVASDPKLWVKAVEKASSVIDWYFQIAFRGQGIGDSGEIEPQKKKEIAKELLPIIKKIPDTIEQAHYVGLLAKRLGISEQVIFEALNKANSQQQTAYSSKEKPLAESRQPLANLSPEEILIGILISNPEQIKIVLPKISEENFSDPLLKNIYTCVLNWYTTKEGTLQEFLKKGLKTDFPKAEMLVLGTQEKYPEITDRLVLDILKRVTEDRSENIKQHYADAIRLAEASGDREKLKALIKEFQDVISK